MRNKKKISEQNSLTFGIIIKLMLVAVVVILAVWLISQTDISPMVATLTIG